MNDCDSNTCDGDIINDLIGGLEYSGVIQSSLDTGGKGILTQQAHGEFIVSSETICLPNTQWVHGEYF